MPKKGENIRKRKDGLWEGRYPSGVTDSGRTKYASVYAKSYAEVKEKLLAAKTRPEQQKLLIFGMQQGNLIMFKIYVPDC